MDEQDAKMTLFPEGPQSVRLPRKHDRMLMLMAPGGGLLTVEGPDGEVLGTFDNGQIAVCKMVRREGVAEDSDERIWEVKARQPARESEGVDHG